MLLPMLEPAASKQGQNKSYEMLPVEVLTDVPAPPSSSQSLYSDRHTEMLTNPPEALGP